MNHTARVYPFNAEKKMDKHSFHNSSKQVMCFSAIYPNLQIMQHDEHKVKSTH